MSAKSQWSVTVLRELQVAFSKHAQPLSVRIIKYAALGCILFFLWNSAYLWIVMGILIAGALTVHFWYRYKTNGWTRSYRGWKYEQNKPHRPNKDSLQ